MTDGDRRDFRTAVLATSLGFGAWCVFFAGWVPEDAQRAVYVVIFSWLIGLSLKRHARYRRLHMPGPALLSVSFAVLCIIVVGVFAGIITDTVDQPTAASVLRPTWPSIAGTIILIGRQDRAHDARARAEVERFITGEA